MVLAGFGGVFKAGDSYAASDDTSVEFSGAVDEWDSILYDAVRKNSDLGSLKAVSDGEYLYIACMAKRMGEDFNVYIEGDAGADKTDLWADASSIGYVLSSDGFLYEMKNGEKAKEGLEADGFFKGDKGFEARISLDKLGGFKGVYTFC